VKEIGTGRKPKVYPPNSPEKGGGSRRAGEVGPPFAPRNRGGKTRARKAVGLCWVPRKLKQQGGEGGKHWPGVENVGENVR